MRRHDLSIARFQALTRDPATGRPRVGRSTISALAGSGGPTPQSGWSGVRRGTLEQLHVAVCRVEPMTLQQMGEMLSVDMSGARAAVWTEISARITEVVAPFCSEMDLRILWNAHDSEPPHVCYSPGGRYVVLAEVPSGWIRKGRLVSVSPSVTS